MDPNRGDAGHGPNQQSGPQSGRSIRLETMLGDNVLLTAVDGVETMSRGFVYTIEFVTQQMDVEVRTLLGQGATVWLHDHTASTRRPIHGHIRQLARLGYDLRDGHSWRGEIVPWMWFLTRSVDCRIYQQKRVDEVLGSVFDELGFSSYRFKLISKYPMMDFCVQYRESAFNFVSRLMEHAGIFYWYEHTTDGHTLVMADDNRVTPYCTPREVRLAVRSDLGEIQQFREEFSLRSGQMALSDFDFEVPTKNLRTNISSIPGATPLGRFEIFDYPGSYTAVDEGKRLTRLRMEAEECGHTVVSGAGNCTAFDAGRRFDLAGDDPVVAHSYLLTQVRHSARDSVNYSSSAPAASYSNTFTAIPSNMPFRPERTTPHPVVKGPQTATVVGPAGENIHVDKYGRVKLLFHWDRRGKRDDRASCWIRVSQQSAGAHWGGLTNPHVGQEIVVAFLEGDPNRPIVIGQVYNGANMPPLHLPADKDKTILRDHGDNKLIMNGKAGQQWMAMVSPKAVNIMAMRSPARSLSASVKDAARAEGDTLDSGPDPDFDAGLDRNGFSELKNLYAKLVNPKTALPQSNSNVDVNTLAEGDVNSLSLLNTNTWVGNDLNQEVIGTTYTKAHGNVTNVFKAVVQNSVEVLQDDAMTVHTEETVVHTEVTGIHVEGTVLHVELVDGMHIEQHLNAHIAIGEATEWRTQAQKTAITEQETKATATLIQAIDAEITTYMSKTQLSQSVTELTAELHTLQAQVYSLTATSISITGSLINILGGMVNMN